MKIRLYDSNMMDITTLPEGWPKPQIGETVKFHYDFDHPEELNDEPIEATVTNVTHSLYSDSVNVELDYPSKEQS